MLYYIIFIIEILNLYHKQLNKSQLYIHAILSKFISNIFQW